MSTTTTTTRNRGDRYGPIEWAQQNISQINGGLSDGFGPSIVLATFPRKTPTFVVEQNSVVGLDCLEDGGSWPTVAPVDAARRIAERRVAVQCLRVADGRSVRRRVVDRRERMYF